MPEGISGAAERRKPRGPEWSKLSPQAALPTIQRRWRLIALVVAAGMILAGLALWLISPRYTSEMMLLFESKRNPVEADTESMMEGRPQDDVTIVGEIQVIRSRDLARKVIDELGLASDPEFAGTQPEEGDFVGAAWVAVKNIFMPIDSGMEMVIDNFLDGLRVTQVTGSPAVLVRYTSKDRDKSAKILATLANSFMISRLENRLQNAKWVGAWLSERIQGMRVQVENGRTQRRRIPQEVRAGRRREDGADQRADLQAERGIRRCRGSAADRRGEGAAGQPEPAAAGDSCFQPDDRFGPDPAAAAAAG